MQCYRLMWLNQCEISINIYIKTFVMYLWIWASMAQWACWRNGTGLFQKHKTSKETQWTGLQNKLYVYNDAGPIASADHNNEFLSMRKQFFCEEKKSMNMETLYLKINKIKKPIDKLCLKTPPMCFNGSFKIHHFLHDIFTGKMHTLHVNCWNPKP